MLIVGSLHLMEPPLPRVARSTLGSAAGAASGAFFTRIGMSAPSFLADRQVVAYRHSSDHKVVLTGAGVEAISTNALRL